MMFKLTISFACLVLLASQCVQSQTVQSYIDAGGCSTAVIGGLASQLRKTMGVEFANLNGISRLELGPAVEAVPHLQQTSLDAIKKALTANPSQTLILNSALRTVPQQLMLYEWFNKGKCGITAAATPGSSNHESGMAIDIKEYLLWKPYLENAGCKWYGAGDTVHFTCPGTDRKGDSVKAFQRLWNCNNPNDKITEDGIYGTNTRARILKSPAAGFDKTC